MNLVQLIRRYRRAIEKAKASGMLDEDRTFCDFPKDCCGDTCYLLAEYLREYGYDTIYVSAETSDRATHAWLILKDENVQPPHKEIVPNELSLLLNSYGGGRFSNISECSYYTEENLADATIIDITADQFGEPKVYFGKAYDFYQQFEFHEASDYESLTNTRLENLYKIIDQFL